MDISAQVFWQGLFNGIALGWIYVLMALGLTLIFGIMRIMQFAHGEIYMLGAYVAYYVTVSIKLPLFMATALSMLVMAMVGLVLERFLFRPVKEDWLSAVIVAVGLSLILQSGAIAMFGLHHRNLPVLAEGPFNITDQIIVPKDRIVAVGVSLFLAFVLYLFLKLTKYGQAMVASAQNPQGAVLQGIAPNKMAALSMGIGCALAAAGGVLAGSMFQMGPFMGSLSLVKGLLIIVIGGMGSLLGALIAGMSLGLIDGLFPVLVGHAWASMSPLFFVIAVLMLRPQGLFGHE
ncbi:MAG: branched-chain amino acid ABC transporter permease [Deltaproteobacteria bacterium]|nr:branched-chain amino acid ABC transporter permease [Deltaproteobacteria bacterium]